MDTGRKALVSLKAAICLFTLFLLIRALLAARWGSVGLCFLSLALYFLPALLGMLLHTSLPPLLEAVAVVFAAAANLGGEVLGLYLALPLWDSCLHFLWGVLAAVLGYAMPDLLGRRAGISRGLPGAAAALLALSFAMLTAVLWEFAEFFTDLCFHTDMQKDAWVDAVYSILIRTDGQNAVRAEEIQSVVVNGQPWPAYLDIGLRDTMYDLLWTFAGAIPGTALVLADHRVKGRPRLLAALMPVPKTAVKQEAASER